MPKIFDRQLEDTRIKRVNEDYFFRMYQKQLLWLANTSEGRDFLCIDKKFPVIHEIAKNYIKHHDLTPTGNSWNRITTSEFRIGAKYANIIRCRWEAWLDYLADYNISLMLRTMPRAYAPEYAYVRGQAMSILHTTSTFFPDPDPETTSVDGVSLNSAIDTFANVRNAATGSFANDSDASRNAFLTQLGGAFFTVQRDFFLFDTSSLADTDTVTAGVISFAATGTAADNADTSSINVVATTPASNTEITTADYDQGGSTVFSTLALSGWTSTDNSYNNLSLDANGIAAISLNSITKLGARNSLDVGNTTPTGLNRAPIYFSENSGTSSDPKLVVTSSSVSSGFAGLQLLTLGIG